MPILSPVKEPGPRATAIAVRSRSVSPAIRKTSSIAPGRSEPCELTGRLIEARTRLAATTPRLAAALPVSRPRIGPAEAPAANSGSPNKTRYVIQDYVCHQDNEQEQTHFHRDFTMAQLERLAAHSLENEKEQMTAVQQGYGKQVDGAELETQPHREHGDLGKPGPHLTARDLRDTDRATKRLARRRGAIDDFGDSNRQRGRHAGGLGKPLQQRTLRRNFALILIPARGHANHPGRCFPVYRLFFDSLRRDRQRDGRDTVSVGPLHHYQQWFAIAAFDSRGQIFPGVHPFSANLHDSVAGAQAGGGGRKTLLHRANDVELQLLQVKLDGRRTWIVADFVAQHSDVAAERRGADRVIGLAAADSRDSRRITDRESQHAHPQPLRYYEMTGFMDYDEGGENSDCGKDGYNHKQDETRASTASA